MAKISAAPTVLWLRYLLPQLIWDKNMCCPNCSMAKISAAPNVLWPRYPLPELFQCQDICCPICSNAKISAAPTVSTSVILLCGIISACPLVNVAPLYYACVSMLISCFCHLLFWLPGSGSDKTSGSESGVWLRHNILDFWLYSTFVNKNSGFNFFTW